MQTGNRQLPSPSRFHWHRSQPRQLHLLFIRILLPDPVAGKIPFLQHRFELRRLCRPWVPLQDAAAPAGHSEALSPAHEPAPVWPEALPAFHRIALLCGPSYRALFVVYYFLFHKDTICVP